MEELRHWWVGFIRSLQARLGELWDKLFNGVLDEWNVATFIISMALVVILTSVALWRRRA